MTTNKLSRVLELARCDATNTVGSCRSAELRMKMFQASIPGTIEIKILVNIGIKLNLNQYK